MEAPAMAFEIRKKPAMSLIFLKAFMISLFRPSTIADDAVAGKHRIVMKNCILDEDLVCNYRKVCAFSGPGKGAVPISYIQTLFTGLLGKFIVSPFFPLTPLGLIHVFQSLEQERPVRTGESLDLECSLDCIVKTLKGVETHFILRAFSRGSIVWQGKSHFFTRAPVRAVKQNSSGTKNIPDHVFPEKRKTIFIPADTGRRYAGVSGDMNPHHLHPVAARFFGFKRAIAHGMWTLARTVACLDMDLGINDKAVIEAWFKRPVFMPAEIALGYEPVQDKTGSMPDIVEFALWDEKKNIPHLKGRLINIA